MNNSDLNYWLSTYFGHSQMAHNLAKDHLDEATYRKAVPIMIFQQRLKVVSSCLLRLIVKGETPIEGWQFLMRPAILDGLYLTYAIFLKQRSEDVVFFFNRIMGDRLDLVEQHIKYKSGSKHFPHERTEELILNFKANLPTHYNIDGTPVYKNLQQPKQLADAINRTDKKLGKIADHFLDKYIILSKYEHANILNIATNGSKMFKDHCRIMALNNYFGMELLQHVINCEAFDGIVNESKSFATMLNPEYKI